MSKPINRDSFATSNIWCDIDFILNKSISSPCAMLAAKSISGPIYNSIATSLRNNVYEFIRIKTLDISQS